MEEIFGSIFLEYLGGGVKWMILKLIYLFKKGASPSFKQIVNPKNDDLGDDIMSGFSNISVGIFFLLSLVVLGFMFG